MKTSEVEKRVVFWAFGLSGLSALIYEVVWFRALSLVLGSTTYALSTMLATFMGGLSIGAYIGGIIADKAKRPVLMFSFLEGMIAVLALIVLPVINLLPPVYAKLFYTFHLSFETFSLAQFLLCSLIMFPPTILMGATFPMVCRICYVGDGIGRETGSVYAINTVGAIAGSILAGFVLIPYFGLKAANIVAALLNLLVAAVVIVLVRRFALSKAYILMAFFLISLVFSYRVSGGEPYPFSYYIGSRYVSYDRFIQDFGFAERLYEKDNAAGNIKVIKTVGGSKMLVNNGKIESSNSGDLVNLATLAYLPASANPGAKSFLNIGLGTGGTVFYAARLPEIEEIYSIEINPSVMDASRLFFHPEIFSDPRIKFITADARNYLSIVDKKYDIISAEPSYPVDQGFSHLYSKEFFEIVKERLNKGGVFCQWVPRYIFRGEEFKMIVKTFKAVFPVVTVWKAKSSDFLILGSESGNFDTDGILRAVSVRLGDVGLPSKDFYLVSDQADVENRLKEYKGKINTDDHPIVEFIGAKRLLEAVYN